MTKREINYDELENGWENNKGFESCLFVGNNIFNTLYNSKKKQNIKLKFISCDFTEIVNFSGFNDISDISLEFEKCFFHKGISLDNISYRGKFSVTLKNTTIDQSLSLSWVNRISNSNDIQDFILIYQCEITKIEILSTDVNIDIRNTQIKSGCAIQRIPGYVKIQSSVFNESTYIGTENACRIEYSDFKKRSQIRYEGIPKNEGIRQYLDIKSSSFEEGIIVKHKLEPDPPKNKKKWHLEHLYLEMGSRSKGEIDISDMGIKRINIKGINYGTNIRFINIDTDIVEFFNFINYGKLNLYNVTFTNYEAKLIVENSSLGAAQLSNINLNIIKPNQVEIVNSNLLEIIPFNTQWFKFNNTYLSTLKSEKLDKIYELSRQLKVVTEKHGDHISSLEFRRVEMEAYRFKDKKLEFKDRLILWAGSTNDHGSDWFKPLWSLIHFLYLLYAVIVISLEMPEIIGTCDALFAVFVPPILFWLFLSFYEDHRKPHRSSYIPKTGRIIILCTILFIFWRNLHLIIYSPAWDCIWSNSEYFFKMLNPVMSIDKVFPNRERFGTLTVIGFFLNHILVSFIVFQVVSAFRKFYQK